MSDELGYGHNEGELLTRLREKRGYVRVAAPVAVAYRVARDDDGPSPSHSALVSCLSMSGAQLVTAEPLEAGMLLEVDLPIPSMLEPSTVSAEVLRCLPAPDAGRWLLPLRFTAVEDSAVRNIGRYVEERVELERLQQDGLALRLNLLQDLSQVLHATMDLEQILAAVIDVALDLAHAEAGSILLVDQAAESLEFAAARGPRAGEMQAFSLAMGEGIAGWVAQTGRPVTVDSPDADTRWQREIAHATDYPAHNLAAVPLRLHEQVIGVLEVLNRTTGRGFTTADLRVLETLGAQASIVIENARIYRELEHSASLARSRVRQAAEKLNIWRRAAEGNMTQAAVCVPIATGQFLANEAAQMMLENLGDHRAHAELKLRSLLDDVRLVAPAAARTSDSYLIHGPDGSSALLMAYVSMLLDDQGECGALVAHLLDMRAG